ncbi:PH domain protein [Arthroderma uncinatum]|uniref:PH domain protein n=1 Tax=Arthroderma uncinatum TaxID=74035 RepID=UPI00144A9F49|nr:PH domain protein [Arthroderma uncinatum]KAF3484195.1 PH domain protein [Arthroderma uncinatum]
MGRLRVLSFLSSRADGSKNKPATSSVSHSTPDLPGTLSQSQPNNKAGASETAPGSSPDQQQNSTLPFMRRTRRLSRPITSLWAQKLAQSDSEHQSQSQEQTAPFPSLEAEPLPWVECFGQLVGTVLSIWNAAALDTAGGQANAPPSFINLADATIKMMETLPTRDETNQPLQHVVSISTAGKNRYLLHFDSLHSLTQWTAAMRLTIFENSLLHESYTGALIAGKGKHLNGIKMILEKTAFKYEDWARVRFGAGTPWRRCWCVISPPSEKEMQLYNRSLKKKSPYDRAPTPPKGNIKFYESKKISKKVAPIASISDAYSAYAIYPQSRPLVDQSTLVKVEGLVTIGGTTSEGFVFVLPEMHHAVSGFETMIRWLFPAYDAFRIYGRPTRLLADTVSPNSLMFAMPSNKRRAYLDILDVSALIHTQGSENWTAREWKKQLKDATSRRMTSNTGSRTSSVSGHRSGKRSSLPPRSGTSVRFGNATVGPRNGEPSSSSDTVASSSPTKPGISHNRSESENTGLPFARRGRRSPPSFEKNIGEDIPEHPPTPPSHEAGIPQMDGSYELEGPDSRSSPDSGAYVDNNGPIDRLEIAQNLQPNPPPQGIPKSPAFSHDPRGTPQFRPQPSPEVGRAANRMSVGTMDQLMDISKGKGNVHGLAVAGATAAWAGAMNSKNANENEHGQQSNTRGVALNRLNSIGASSSNYSQGSPVTPSDAASNVNVNVSYTPTSIGGQSPIKQQQDENQLPVQQKRISRKPLAAEIPIAETASVKTESTLGSLRDNIDMDALDRIIRRPRSPSPPPPPQQKYAFQREPVILDDASSVVSPSYASSHRSSASVKSIQSIQKPRMGKMKVVGDAAPKTEDLVIGDARYKHPSVAPNEVNPDIPTVDFGPTHTYKPTTRRPSTSDTMLLLSSSHQRDPSVGTLGARERRLSTGRLLEHLNQESPSSHSPPPPTTQERGRRRSVLWQPGMVPDSGPVAAGAASISPEQFVHNRASRSQIHLPLQSTQSTPPPRPASGDWSAYIRQQSSSTQLPQRPHSRGPSVMLDTPARPSSRGATTMLDGPPRPSSRGASVILGPHDLPPRPSSRGANRMLAQPDVSGQLSAREQEHIARVTGSSFLNLNNSQASQGPQFGSGLVSAIDARERERKAMKEGPTLYAHSLCIPPAYPHFVPSVSL